MYDAVLIGAGHNALVCAHDLAAAGWKVFVAERRPFVGGCCVTEELWPGYRVNPAAYVVSLLLPEIERDMRLADYGYEVLARNPSSFTPLEDGRYLLLGPDQELTRKEIAKFSQQDAEAYPRYEEFLTRVAEKLEPVLSLAPPDLLPLPSSWRKRSIGNKVQNVRRGWDLYRAFQELGEELPEAIELLTGSATALLDRWFESDELKGTLATDAIIGTFQPPSSPGTAYVLLHHVMGSSGGARGVWGYVKGGMGQLSEAMAASARDRGAKIRTDCGVESIIVRDDRAIGVRLTGGEVIDARTVISGVDPHLTFERFLSPSVLPEPFRKAVGRIDYASASMKINLAVSELPDFTCLPGNGEPGPQHRGTIHIGSTPEYVERAYDDAKYGEPSAHPVIEMTIPSSVDSSLAPEGHHIISCFVQYAPYHLATGNWDERKQEFADRCLAEIAKFAPNVPGSVIHRQVVSPIDLERTFGLTGGNIFQGAMPLHQLFSMRPVPGWSDYRTPLAGLYLCGAATHPGGGVMGACGRNASREILRDGRRSKRK